MRFNHKSKQDRTEQGLAQLKLEFDFTLIFYKFGLTRFGLESSFWMVRKLVRLYLQSRPALLFTPSSLVEYSLHTKLELPRKSRSANIYYSCQVGSAGLLENRK